MKKCLIKIVHCLLLVIVLIVFSSCGKIKEVNIEESEITLSPGSIYQLNISTTPEKNDSTVLSWESSNLGVVIVDSNGYACAVAEGFATIQCSVDGVSDSCAVIVLSEYDALYLTLTEDEKAVVDHIDWIIDTQYGKNYNPETNKILAIWNVKKEANNQSVEILFAGKNNRVSDIEAHWSSDGARGMHSSTWGYDIPETDEYNIDLVNNILKLKYS